MRTDKFTWNAGDVTFYDKDGEKQTMRVSDSFRAAFDAHMEAFRDYGTPEGARKAAQSRRAGGGGGGGGGRKFESMNHPSLPYTKKFSEPAPEHRKEHSVLLKHGWQPEAHYESRHIAFKGGKQVTGHHNTSIYVHPKMKNQHVQVSGERKQWFHQPNREGGGTAGFGASSLNKFLSGLGRK